MALHRRNTVGIPTDGFSSVWNVLFTLAFFAAAGYGVYWGITKIYLKADDEVARTPSNPLLAPRKPTPAANPNAPQAPVFVTDRYRPGLDSAAADVNIAMLAREAARYSGDSGAMARNANKAAEARGRYNSAAAGERDLPEVLDPDDEVISLDQVDLVKLRPEAASSYLNQAIRRIAAATYFKVRVRRGNGSKDCYLYFARATGTDAAVDVVPGRVKISSPLALDIQNNVLTLPTNVLMDVERKTIERVLGCGEATAEEFAMIQRHLRGAVTANVDADYDRDRLAQHLGKLAPLLNASPVPEAVITTDGRRFIGSIFSDTPEGVTVQTVVGYILVPRAEVKRVILMKDMREEFNRRIQVAHEHRDALPLLFQWTKEMEMPVHREYVAVRMLQMNPLDYGVRIVAGYKQGADGKYTPEKCIAFGAPIPVRKPTSREDVRTELEVMGFMMRNDKWYTKTPWVTGIDSLHKPSEVKVAYAGTQIFTWHEEDSPKARLFNPTGKPKDGSPARLRFIAPQGAQGTVTLTLEAPGEILDCKVKASGGIVEAGHNARIEVFLVTDLGKPVLLYDIDSGGDQNPYDVTQHIRGKRKFGITARITTTRDSYHTYARFLSSLPDGKEAFLVQGSVIRPSPEIDKVWMNAR